MNDREEVGKGLKSRKRVAYNRERQAHISVPNGTSLEQHHTSDNDDSCHEDREHEEDRPSACSSSKGRGWSQVVPNCQKIKRMQTSSCDEASWTLHTTWVQDE